jgi:hypothetical protein
MGKLDSATGKLEGYINWYTLSLEHSILSLWSLRTVMRFE